MHKHQSSPKTRYKGYRHGLTDRVRSGLEMGVDENENRGIDAAVGDEVDAKEK